jgi:ankyrin repeat protein
MWKKITPFMILFVLFAATQISCREHELTPQQKDFLEQLHAGNSAEIARLIKTGANIRIKDQHGNTPLHIVSLRGNCESIELLLNKGAKIHSTNDNGDTPLHRAASGGNCEIIELLIKNGAKVHSTNNNDSTPLHKSAEYGRLKAAKLLIEKGADVSAKNSQDKTPIFLAAYSGNLDLVKFLVEKGAYIQTTGYTPLHDAVRNSSLRRQSENSLTEMVEYFLSKGVDVNAAGDPLKGLGTTALHYAAMVGSKEIVKLLIENGAKVDARSQNSETPLFGTAIGGAVEAAKVLLDNGADVNARNDRNNTPLHFALMERSIAPIVTFGDRIEIVKLLLDHGADVNARNNNQCTPLHNAVAYGWFKNVPTDAPEYKQLYYKTIIQMLLESGADPNVKDSSGRTPLKLVEGEPEIIELLIKYGAKD